MPKQKTQLKDAMHLEGFDAKSTKVFEHVLSLYDYYEELHPVIDSNDFRKKHGVVRLVGTKYDAKGKIEEQWENFYTAAGALSGGVVRDQHGAVIREMKI